MTDAQYELFVERYIDAPPEIVFRVWTERTAEWWCPKPWTTELIQQDLRPGGRVAMIMRGPDGESVAEEGVVLEVVDNERIAFTDAFAAGWLPKVPFMVGIFTFTPEGGGTRYRAASRHWDEVAHQRHREMGFAEGWGAVAAQLAALAEDEAAELRRRRA